MRAQTRPGIARGTDIREVTHQVYGQMANGSRITKMDWKLRAPCHPIVSTDSLPSYQFIHVQREIKQHDIKEYDP